MSESATSQDAPSDISSSDIAPAAIAEILGRRVIGQREALREMAIALSKKLAGLSVGNLLMIGGSGTGKTTLMRAVEHYLAARSDLALLPTVVRMHANVLGEEAERGRPGTAILGRLLERAREQLGSGATFDETLERARRGIVFIDEVDKIRTRVGDRPNTAGIRAQEALLTVMENEAVPYEPPAWARDAGDGDGHAADRGVIMVDTSGILFICAGAFEGLYDSVFDRITVGTDRGALQPTTVVEDGTVHEKLVFHLRDWLRNEDLFDYGMSPQFLSRFDAVVLLADLTIEDLERIFLETPDSGFRRARQYFRSRGIDLLLSRKAVRRIAAEAHRNPRLGARALKEVFRRVVRDYEFEPEKAVNRGDDQILLDVPQVEEALAARKRG